MIATPISLVAVQSMHAAPGALATSRLAVDVDAAADVLENLRRMLRSQGGDPAPSGRAAIALSAPAMTSARAPLVPAERRHIGVRGFLVGIAFSAAIGALLFVFTAAG